jgi:hypothetical protein
LLKVRDIFIQTLKDCNEKMTWGVVVFSDNKFYIASMKTRVHVGFAINGLSQEEIKLFEGSGKTMRHIKIKSIDDIDEKKLVQLIKMVDKKSTCII